MSRRNLIGFAAAACVACCAAPFLVAVGGITALGIAGTFVFGVAALAVAGLTVAALATMRRRRRSSAYPDAASRRVQLRQQPDHDSDISPGSEPFAR